MKETCRAASPGIVACWLGDVPDVQGVESCECTWEAKVLSIRTDCRTLGVLVLYTKGEVTDWVDLVITDLALTSLTEQRIADLETELGAPMSELEVARQQFDREHGQVLGSSSFTIIRLSRVRIRIA